MEKRNLKEISNLDTFALTAIIDYWRDYEANTVLLAYGELKRRKYNLNDKLNKRINDFCVFNSYDNIDSILLYAIKETGFNSYDEYYEQENITKKIENLASDKVSSEKKYPALRTISEIYKIFGWLTIVVTLIVAFILGQANGLLALISIIIGALIVLGVFAVAESIMVFVDIEQNTRLNSKK